jgi:hypothetical protein
MSSRRSEGQEVLEIVQMVSLMPLLVMPRYEDEEEAFGSGMEVVFVGGTVDEEELVVEEVILFAG